MNDGDTLKGADAGHAKKGATGRPAKKTGRSSAGLLTDLSKLYSVKTPALLRAAVRPTPLLLPSPPAPAASGQ